MFNFAYRSLYPTWKLTWPTNLDDVANEIERRTCERSQQDLAIKPSVLVWFHTAFQSRSFTLCALSLPHLSSSSSLSLPWLSQCLLACLPFWVSLWVLFSWVWLAQQSLMSSSSQAGLWTISLMKESFLSSNWTIFPVN